jgi:DNA-binding response OmpR family regulator
LQGAFETKGGDNYLIDSGLVKDGQIQMPLFDKYIKEFEDMLRVRDKIEYDENTNSIRKGGTVLSDRLTSSEFRLLRYLLQNRERVVERDEIISIVWENVKSSAGITDQAVDQLIFRLRKKIEEDPNSPTQLQTVKGRGFKFSG